MLRLAIAVALGLGLGWLAVGAARHSPATCDLHGSLPDRHCTPGSTRPLNAAEVCRLRPVPAPVSSRVAALVYETYGIAVRERDDYRLDELIPRSLGGLAASHNLWPEPLYGRPPPAAKRALESRLRVAVCAGRLSLGAAQQRLAADWVTAYGHLRP